MSHGGVNPIKAILYALTANAGIALSKAGAAFYTGSGAMMAEAIHSFADCANQLLLLLGIKQSQQDATDDHPMGFGKATYFWSFLVAIILFSLGGMFSIYEGVHKLQHPEPLNNAGIAIAILLGAVVMESLSLRGAIGEIRKNSRGMSLWRYFRNSREAELVVILGEDMAALAGLVFALIAVTLTFITGNPVYDAMGMLVVGGLLVVVAVLLSIEIHGMLIGQSADPQVVTEMKAWLRARPEIAELYQLITLQFGSEYMVSIKARMREEASATAMINDINRVEADLKAAFPGARWSFFEPDNRA